MKAKSEKRRPFFGNQVEDCRDSSGLFYILSFTKGYLTNWDVQKNVFDHVWMSEYPVDFKDSRMIVTEPIFNFSSIQEAMVETFFEEYYPLSLTRCTAPDLAQYNYVNTQGDSLPLCCLIVDLGYSFCHIVPYVKGEKVLTAIRRIDVGGKLLTNQLKDIISYRQLNVMDETYVINRVKEDSCFVSENFYEDMRIAKKYPPENPYRCEYVLPDCTNIKKGYIQPYGTAREKTDDYQHLKLNIERFSVPELLFHPSDIGISQMGISEAIIDAIKGCPEETHPHLYANIVVVGGTAKFPGMLTRLQKDVRSMAPEWFHVNITLPDDPQTYAWQGGKYFADDEEEFGKYTITRQQYNEIGSARDLLFGEN
jgi:actin-related protein 6